MTDTAHAHHNETRKYRGVMPDAYYRDLGRCETGGKRGKVRHASRNYTGAFGIYRGTARRWAGTPTLAHKTYRQQIKIADRIAFTGWTNRRGERVYPVGPFGWGAVTANCRGLLKHLCRATHPKAQKYRARACRMAANG